MQPGRLPTSCMPSLPSQADDDPGEDGKPAGYAEDQLITRGDGGSRYSLSYAR
jgi:hypothetical protein